VRPVGPAETARKQIGRDLVAEIRQLDARLAALSTQMTQAIAEHGSRLPDVDGIGPIVATRLLGRTGRAGRFPSSSAFASYAGVAPVEVASADRARHRLPRGADRQLNLALHIAALTQVRMRASTGRAYYDRKIAEGKTHNEAMRCLKRRLADHVWRIMIADVRRQAAAGRTFGSDSDIQRGWPNPDIQLFGQVTARGRWGLDRPAVEVTACRCR
jgi:transposase